MGHDHFFGDKTCSVLLSAASRSRQKGCGTAIAQNCPKPGGGMWEGLKETMFAPVPSGILT